MFEAKLAAILDQQLGKFVNGLDAAALKVGVWSGEVVLRGLTLKPEALAGLNLPLTVTAGTLGSLTLKVPWNKLGRRVRLRRRKRASLAHALHAPLQRACGCAHRPRLPGRRAFRGRGRGAQPARGARNVGPLTAPPAG